MSYTPLSDLVAGDSGNNAQVVSGARKEVAYSTTTAQAAATTDVSNYAWVSVHQLTNGTAAFTNFQGSNDGVNWVGITLTRYDTTGASLAPANSIAAGGVIYHGPLAYRYFRLNVAGITAGTTAGTVEFFSSPRQASAALASVALVAASTGGYSYNNITGAATTTVKSGAGTLHSLTINTFAASATITIYDNTAGSGTKIGTITVPATLLDQGPRNVILDIAFTTGLTIVTTGTQDITVAYK